MQLEPWDFMAVYYDAIDHFCHGFMRYHPPKLEWVKDEDFEMYKDVVDGAYCYHDMMLGTLMKLVDEQTVIMLISDHGFHSDHLRPMSVPNEPAGPAAEHRDHGIFVLSGPGIRKDETVFGANLLDVAPTVLSIFGLPVGKDMDGRVLVSAFEEPPELEFIESWEQVEGESGQHPVDMQLDSAETQESIRQLVELGYIDEPDKDVGKAARDCMRELDDNLARAYIDAGRHLEAAKILESLWEEWPEESRFGVRLLNCYVELRETALARKTMDKIRRLKAKFAAEAKKELEKIRADEKAKPETEDPEKLDKKEMHRRRRLAGRSKTNVQAVAFLEASVLELEQQEEKALKLLQKAAKTDRANQARVFQRMGNLHLKLRQWEQARDCFEQVLELDPNDFRAMTGISRCLLRFKKFEAAAEYARGSIGLLYHNPHAHYFHGLALYKMGNSDIAVKALQMAIRQNENFPLAHRRLAFIYRKELGDEVQANYHRRQSAEARKRIGRFRPAITNNEKKPVALDVNLIDQLSTTQKIGNITVPESDVITVVSGLPRSGTSVMMQMLANGGMNPLSDGKRQSDENNPKGYFEFEKVKALAKDRSWVAEGKGKAIKVVAPLVPFLPPIYHYRFIFMIRSLEEVVDSQAKMLQRLGKQTGSTHSGSLEETFKKQLQNAIRVASQSPLSEVIAVKYDDVLKKPLETATRICKFLQIDLDLERMAAVVDPTLYRSKF